MRHIESHLNMTSERLKKWLFFVLSVSVLALLLYYCQKLIDINQVIAEFKELSGAAVIISTLLLLASRYFQAMRFRAIQSFGLSGWRHMGISLAGQFVNAVVPMRGGEVVRPFYLMKMGQSPTMKSILLTTVLDKVVETLALSPYLLSVYFLYFAELSHLVASLTKGQNKISTSMAVITLTALMVFTAALIYRKRALLRSHFSQLKNLGLSLTFGLLHWGFFALGFAALLGSVKPALFVALAANFASAVPVAPGSLGVFEASFVWAGRAVIPELSAETLLAQGVVLHFIYLFIPILVGTGFFLRYGRPQTKQDR